MPDNKDRVALMYGPLVLAGQLGPVDDPNASDPLYVPVLMTNNRNPETWMEPISDRPNSFKTKDVGRPRDIVFKPFYQTHDCRYSVYFDIFDEEKWEEFQEEYKAQQEAKKQLEARTIDFFQPGEFYTAIYDLPDDLDISNGTITVKFVPKDHHRAGPIFGIRTLKK